MAGEQDKKHFCKAFSEALMFAAGVFSMAALGGSFASNNSLWQQYMENPEQLEEKNADSSKVEAMAAARCFTLASAATAVTLFGFSAIAEHCCQSPSTRRE